MKFKKLISAVVLFISAFFGLAPAHADYPVSFTPVVNKVVATPVVVANNYPVSFTVVSPYANIKPVTLSLSATTAPANVPAQIAALKVTPTLVTFNISKK
jgi:hypothetical protein